MLPAQPFSAMSGLYGASDAVLVSLRDVPLFRDTLPSKLFEVMAARVPVLGLLTGEAREVIETAGAGVCGEPERCDALLAALDRLRRLSPRDREAFGRAGRAWVEQHCSRQTQAADYARLLSTLTTSANESDATPLAATYSKLEAKR